MKSGTIPIRRALISVSDKDNLNDLAKFLESLGIDLVSTGGTARYLKKGGLRVTEVSDLTGFPEILNGRVKTLHPKVHAPILFDRNDAVSTKELKKMDSEAIDLVVVNLYPFETILRANAPRKNIIENIDIGGVALMRAAAKNFDHVTVISDTEDYIELKEELIMFKGCTRRKTREFFAGKAFSQTSYYDHLITGWFLSKKQSKPLRSRVFGGKSIQDLSMERTASKRNIFKQSSYRNKNKTIGEYFTGNSILQQPYRSTAAYKILCELEDYKKSSCVIIKHGNPCGVSVDNNILVHIKSP